MKTLKVSLLTSLLLASPLLFAGEKVNETVETNGKGRISIDVMNGKVKISTWDKNEVKVVGELDDDAEGYTFVAQGDGDVFFKVEMPEKRWGSWSSDEGSDLEVFMPKTSSLKFEGVNVDVSAQDVFGGSRLNTVNGDVTASNLKKRVNLETVNGQINANDLEGKISLNTVNGAIKDVNSSGKLTIETVNGHINSTSTAEEVEVANVNGDIELNFAAIKELEIGTVNGDLELELGLAENGSFSFSSVGGDANIYFADGLSASINVEAHAGGDIDNYLTKDKAKEARFGPGESIRFKVGEGSADVEIDTVSGDIKLRKKK